MGPALPHRAAPPRLARADRQPLRQESVRESSASSGEPPRPAPERARGSAARRHARRPRSTRSPAAARSATATAPRPHGLPGRCRAIPSRLPESRRDPFRSPLE